MTEQRLQLHIGIDRGTDNSTISYAFTNFKNEVDSFQIEKYLETSLETGIPNRLFHSGKLIALKPQTDKDRLYCRAYWVEGNRLRKFPHEFFHRHLPLILRKAPNGSSHTCRIYLTITVPHGGKLHEQDVVYKGFRELALSMPVLRFMKISESEAQLQYLLRCPSRQVFEAGTKILIVDAGAGITV